MEFDYGLLWLASPDLLMCLMSLCCVDYGLLWVARETQNFASLLADAVVIIV